MAFALILGNTALSMASEVETMTLSIETDDYVEEEIEAEFEALEDFEDSLTEEELANCQNEFGDESFTTDIGAEAILEILKSTKSFRYL